LTKKIQVIDSDIASLKNLNDKEEQIKKAYETINKLQQWNSDANNRITTLQEEIEMLSAKLTEKENDLKEQNLLLEDIKKKQTEAETTVKKLIHSFELPADRILYKVLENIHELATNNSPINAYFCYAWPKQADTKEKEKLHKWLRQLKEYLKKAGFAKVFLDIDVIGAGSTTTTMEKYLKESNVFFLIGTKRFKERMIESTKNNLQFELELIFSMHSKRKNSKSFIIPLLLESKNMDDIFKTENDKYNFKEHLIYDFYASYKLGDNDQCFLKVYLLALKIQVFYQVYLV